MNTKKDFTAQPSINVDHKQRLRSALLVHMKPAKRHNKKMWWLAAAAVPVGALAVFSVIALLPAYNKQNGMPEGNIVQRTFSPLTAQQVFAEAEKTVSQELLTPGKYYFMRKQYSLAWHDSDTACRRKDIVQDTYTNQQGFDVKTLSYDKNMKLFAVSSSNEVGEPVPGYFSDETIAAGINSPVDCSQVKPLTPGSAVPAVDSQTWAKSAEVRGMVKLISHVPSDQREGYEILKSIQGWGNSELRTIPGFKEPVIVLHIQDPGWKIDHFYYFDQTTKQFVGHEDSDSKTIILERGIRSIPKIPEADNNLLPS